MKIVNILVGGPVEHWPQTLREGNVQGQWIGVDRGAIRLIQIGIIPDLAVGDFDSTPAEELTVVRDQVAQIKQFPPEKDLTDTQIGVLSAIDNFKPDQINIYGATGGRMDHLLANIFLPLETQFRDFAGKIRIIDAQNTITYYLPGSYEIEKEADKKYLAFANLTAVKGLTLPDEKYTLNDFSSSFPISWASNEFDGTVNQFSFDEGVVAVIQSRD